MGAVPIIGLIVSLMLAMVSYCAFTYAACKWMGFRPTVVSVGFGPKLFKIKRGETEYQLGLVPFLAYVQIAGMNPLEERDPNDRSLFLNASPCRRGPVFLAGPLGQMVI